MLIIIKLIALPFLNYRLNKKKEPHFEILFFYYYYCLNYFDLKGKYGFFMKLNNVFKIVQ